MDDRARDRGVLITGCSSGIGACVAAGLEANGYRVFATARQAEDVARLAREGYEALRLDLTDSASIRGTVTEVLDRNAGRLYALFNNGAYGQPGAVEDLTREVLAEQFETNVFGWHELACAVLPAMRRQGYGRIVQNSSVLGLVSLRFRGAYVSSKFAIEGLSDTLRLELRGTGIHVSLVEPGPVVSAFRENAYAAFKRNIDVASSPHRGIYQRVEARLAAEDGDTPFTLPATAVLKKVVHALESPRPRPRYYVTFPTYLFGTLRRLLSTRWLDAVLAHVSRAETR
ncbi:MAG: SDR family oxidoreductase, partial [Gammaproteobacteria bacterium]